MESMFEIPGSDIICVHITEDVVNKKKNPCYTRSNALDKETKTDESPIVK